MKVLSVVGARPQFIKAFPVSLALKESNHEEFSVHTGQHYDYSMSQIFFDEMCIQSPSINLAIGSGNHGAQTGKMLIELEKIMMEQKPDWVLVYGDTNSTLAGALAACKLQIPVAHVEAGLRSFNRSMPEEHNRLLTDHCSDLLFCPTANAVEHLRREGVVENVYLIGDTMYDAVLRFGPMAERHSVILDRLQVSPGSYALATVHRPYNTDNPHALRDILTAFGEVEHPIIFPIHPRTYKKINDYCIDTTQVCPNVSFLEPLGYFDMLVLEKNACMIFTDSGGVQKEAFFFGTPCITLRPETEWVETVDLGWNHLVGANKDLIVSVSRTITTPTHHPQVYGNEESAHLCVQLIETATSVPSTFK